MINPSCTLSKGFFCIILFFSHHSVASDFGTDGVITIPNARMGEDGTFRATVSGSNVVSMFNLTYQVLPRVETTFRYSIFNPRRLRESEDDLRDRSYALKLKMLEERQILPALSVGIRDILGTGAWSGEYLVASKGINRFDVTAGIGWGRFSDRGGMRNPLGILSNSFDSRMEAGAPGGRQGGKIRGSTFFRGPIGVFGGIEYDFANLPLSLLLEYNSDAYSREASFGTITDSKAFSYGVSWDLPKGSRISISRQQDNFIGLNISYAMDTASNPRKKKGSPFFSSLSNQKLDLKDPDRKLTTWYARSLYDFERSGMKLRKANLSANSTHASLEIENVDYAFAADAINRALVLAQLHLPKRVETIEIHTFDSGLIGPRIVYNVERGSSSNGQKRSSRRETLSVENLDILAPSFLENPNKRTNFNNYKLATSLDLGTRLQLFDPDEPLRHQVFALLGARFILSDHLNVWGAYSINVTNDFSTARRSDSVLPHVRSDLNLYLTEGETGLNSLFLESRYSVSASLHNRSYIGVLEEMYSGIGTEFLYHKYDRRWAIGGSLSWVRQRDYEKNFNHLDYQTTLGFLSFYYATPFRNFDLAAHFGRYLAKDRGFTFEARRTFANGFEIAAYITRTNVSAADFGEGSFDKGLIFRIPFNYFISKNTRGAYSTLLRSMNRDGGRRLEDFGQNLWYDRRSLRLDKLNSTKPRMIP